ncbi:MAG TPA: cation transporter [Gemmatimonadaceae bacterium]|jgi:divalent metal cation (Fe/Co/Zn/Cd) transporter
MRDALVRRGLALNYATIAYNSFEAVVALIAGVLAGSVALMGFGIDSVIEVTASGAAQWRLRVHSDDNRRDRVERITHRIIGWGFLALAAYVTIDSAKSLYFRERPDRSLIGILILTLSVLVMPLLARAKRSVARQLESRALEADAQQTSLCAYLSVIALLGVTLNALFGWWWADPVAALGMVPIIMKEGFEGIRGNVHCDDCAS